MQRKKTVGDKMHKVVAIMILVLKSFKLHFTLNTW